MGKTSQEGCTRKRCRRGRTRGREQEMQAGNGHSGTCDGFNALGTQTSSLWKYFTSKDVNNSVLITPS